MIRLTDDVAGSGPLAGGKDPIDARPPDPERAGNLSCAATDAGHSYYLVVIDAWLTAPVGPGGFGPGYPLGLSFPPEGSFKFGDRAEHPQH